MAFTNLIGKKINHNGHIGEVIEQDGYFILIKFSYGKFVFNSQKINEKNWV